MEAQILTAHPKPGGPAAKRHVRAEVLALADFTQKAVKLARPEILAIRLQAFLDGGTHTADELWHALTSWERADLFRIAGLSPVLPAPAPANERPQDVYRRLTMATVAAIKPLGFEVDRDHTQRWGHRWHQVSLLFQADQFQANPLGEWVVVGRHSETGALVNPQHFRLRDEADVAIIAGRLAELVG